MAVRTRGLTRSPQNKERYYSFNQYLRDKFGTKVYKVTVDAAFTCPNRDGAKAWGGCTFCNNEGFSINSRDDRAKTRSVREQIETGIAFKRERYKAEKFLAYFQAYTNTYRPIEELKPLYDEALSIPDVIGLDIGTRPDCAPEPVLDLIESYTDSSEVWLEYGLQTAHDRTLEAVNRGHDYASFVDAMERTNRREGINICVHVILGLPGESREDMMETARKLGQFEFHGIKIHLLHIMKRTVMEKQYREGRIRLLEMDEYADLVAEFLEYIPPHVTIHRLTGDAPPDVLVAPDWCLKKGSVFKAIHEAMDRRGFRQGSQLG
jgi:uncharacterized protein